MSENITIILIDDSCPVELEGIVTVTVRFNPSLGNSFTAKHTLLSLGLPWQPHTHSTTVQYAAGYNQVSPGHCTIQMDVRGQKTQVKAMVINSGQTDILLGGDWLRSQEAFIDCVTQEVYLTTLGQWIKLSPSFTVRGVVSRGSCLIPLQDSSEYPVCPEQQ